MNQCTTCGYANTTASKGCTQCTARLTDPPVIQPSVTNVAPPPAASRAAIAALVLGILGFLISPAFGPFAWLIGHGELQAIDADKSPRAGRGVATAGTICGIVGTALFAIYLLRSIATLF
jgi:Domain of unknown function (DUF4190)